MNVNSSPYRLEAVPPYSVPVRPTTFSAVWASFIMAAPWSVLVDLASCTSSHRYRYTRSGNTVAMYSASGSRGLRLAYFSPGLGAENVRLDCHRGAPHVGHFCGARDSQLSSAMTGSPFLARVTIAPHDGQTGTRSETIRSPLRVSGPVASRP
ncbi:MAG: hypothetical protein QUS11_06405, partial [Candidatus Fermentibacter sp.]|nr:hypothetical protein [Candidatus Fermentibacter sp.]